MQDVTLFFVGVLMGAMNAVAGGGILIGFPVMLALGISPMVANVTGHVIVLPGLISSVYGFRKPIKQVPRKYLWLLVPIVFGTAIGAIILKHTTSAQFAQIVPLLIFLSVLLFAYQPYLHHQLHKHIHTKSRRVKPLVLIGIALVPVSIYGGYFGAGFGFIMLAFLGFTKLHAVHKMNGLKNLAGLAVSLVTMLFFLTSGLINWRLAFFMGLGTALGGYYSALLSQRVSTHAIRLVVITVGFCTAAYIGINSAL
jgi:uncharacterized membrane protein YfcA